MSRNVGRQQQIAVHARIDLRGAYRRVTKQLLDDPQIRPMTKHVRCAGVPQNMRRDVSVDTSDDSELANDVPRSLAGDSSTSAPEKHCIGIGTRSPLPRREHVSTAKCKPVFERTLGGSTKGNDALF